MDRFDDIWKNRFNEEELSVGDWNTPDELIWDGIAQEVSPKKNKRRLLWFWLSLGLVLILLLSAILMGGGKNTTEVISEKDYGTLISEESGTTNNIVKIDEDHLIRVGEEDHLKSDHNNNQGLAINVSPARGKEQRNNSNVNAKRGNSNFNNSIVNKSSISNTHFSSTSSLSTNQEGIPSNEIQLKDVVNTEGVKLILSKPKQRLVDLPTLEVAMLTSKSIAPFRIFLEPATILNQDVDARRMLSIGVQTGAVNWRHRISDTYTSDLSPFDFNYKNSWGWQTNVNLNFSISKRFEIFTGVQYERVITQSGHNSILSYNLDDENDPNNPLNAYALSLATPYGLAGANFNFSRTQGLSSNVVDLGVDFHSEHLIQNVSVPVGVNFYPIGRKQKIVPSLNAGLGINYLNIQNRIDRIDTHHAAIQFDDSGTSEFVKPDINQLHFDYRVGAGFNYKINQGWNLQLNYNWARGINPIFKQDNYNTRIDRHHISLGITKFLNKSSN